MLRRNPLEFTRKLRSLDRGELAFLGQAWTLAPLVEASLASLGLQRTLRWLEAAFAPRTQRPAPTVERAAQLVDATYRHHMLQGECLPRALVQYALLRRACQPVRFVIGVHAAAGLRAHAWVQTLDEDPEDPTRGRHDASHGGIRFEPLLVVEA